jgi:hypothetical protein
MFRTVPLSFIRSLFTVHSAMVYVIQVCRQRTIVVCVSRITPMAEGCFICVVSISLVIVLFDTSNFVTSGGILFKMLVLGTNETVLQRSSEVLKGYSLFLIYKTNIFIKLLKLI